MDNDDELHSIAEPSSPAGDYVDQLLLLASLEDPSLNDFVTALRLKIRSVRPEADYGWSEKISEEVRDQASVDGRSDRAARALFDVIALAENTSSAYHVHQKWGLADAAPPDHLLELRQFMTTVSFDEVREAFNKHLDSEDVLSVVLRGHLWIEKALNGLLTRSFAHPEAMNGARFSFAQKVTMARAVGQLSADETAAILRLNKLRNRLAHQVEAELDARDESELIAICSWDPSLVDMLSHPRAFPQGIISVIVVLVVRLHRKADLFDAEARYSAYTQRSVIRLLEDRDRRNRAT